MKKYISISQYPGRTGQYFYTEFFKHYNIDAVYEPRSATDLNRAVEQAVLDNVAGISVSMPFKKDVIEYLDKKDYLVDVYNSCNTINMENGQLVGYNCDFAGVEYTVEEIAQASLTTITILGNGAMGTMYKDYLIDNNYNPFVCARSNNRWDVRHFVTEVIINTTSFGTATDASPLDYIPPGVQLVIDLAIKPNQLQQQCLNHSIKYISGAEFYKQQFLRQFEIYTGIVPDSLLYDKIKQNYETI
jgi:shikimate dehydrogenase